MSASIRWGVPIDPGAGAGSAIGDATCSGTMDDAASPAASAAPRSLLAFWAGGAEAGTAVNFQDGAGSASGDATASATGEVLVTSGAGSATGDATCSGVIEDATPVVVTPPVVVDAGGVGMFPGAWGKPVKKPKKKKRLEDELDELIAELRSRIVEDPYDPRPDLERTLRVSQALASQPAPSFSEVENQIALLQEAINEIDDEEVILLLAA